MYKVSTLADEYKKKLVTADEAVAIVKPGDRVHSGTGCGSPVDLDEAMARRADSLKDVHILSCITIRKAPSKLYLATQSNDQVRLNPLISAAQIARCAKKEGAGTSR